MYDYEAQVYKEIENKPEYYSYYDFADFSTRKSVRKGYYTYYYHLKPKLKIFK